MQPRRQHAKGHQRRRRRPTPVIRGLAIAILLVGLGGLVAPSAPVGADANEGPANGEAFASITAGYRHSCALLTNGAVKCWGNNSAGQLGLGDNVGRGDASDEMGDHLPAVDLGPGRSATALAAGAGFTCAILDDASLKCWGDNGAGQMGQGVWGETTSRGDAPGEMGADLPAIDLGTGRTVVAVAAGFAHACAVLDNGALKCWGHNTYGQLGLGDTLSRGADANQMGDSLPAVNLGAGRTALAVAASDFSTCALLDDASVKCWGRNNAGQLGLGNTADRGDAAGEMGDSLPAVDLGTGRSAVALTGGGGSGSGFITSGHTCALLDDASVKCWGSNAFGQLGLGGLGFGGNRGDAAGEMGDNLPVIALGAGRTALAVAAGQSNNCVVLDNYSVKCWGGNSFGQLGLGLPATQNLGDQMNEMGDNLPALSLGTGLTPVAVTAGMEHGCARFADNSVKCWGRNDNGGLGLGNTATRGLAPTDMGDNLPKVDLGSTAGEVAGTLTEAGSGAPIAGGWVLALRTSDYSVAGGAIADGSGEFALSVEGAGYRLYLIDGSGAHAAGFHGGGNGQLVSVPTGGTVGVDPVMPAVRGAVTSTVTTAGSGAPISGAWALSLSTSPSHPGATELVAVADDEGRVRLENLAPGTHIVGFVDPAGAHQTRFHPNSVDVPGATPISVSAGAVTVANAALPAQGAPPVGQAITGTVTEDGTGAVIPQAHVLALRSSDYSLARGAVADDDGHYTLSVPSGSYFLAVLDPTGRHGMEWYDDVAPAGLAGATAVAAPATADASLAPTGGAMAGTLTDAPSGDPLGGAWVIAIGPSGIAGSAVTQIDGTYRIAGLPAGTYRAAFIDPTGAHRHEYSGDAADYASGTAFPVVVGATATTDAALAPPTP